LKYQGSTSPRTPDFAFNPDTEVGTKHWLSQV